MPLLSALCGIRIFVGLAHATRMNVSFFTYSSHFLFAFTEKNDCGLSDGCANDDGKQEPNTITNGKGTFKITAAYIMDVNNQIYKRTLPLSIEVND